MISACGYLRFRDGARNHEGKYHSFVHKFALFVVAWTVFLLTAGALVTSNDAALAVPDWPLSYGTLNPPMVGGIFYNFSGHRVIAAILGLLIIILAALIWKKDERPWLSRPSVWPQLAV